ncbi:MAG: asparaginase [Bdellovibrionales bacterium]
MRSIFLLVALSFSLSAFGIENHKKKILFIGTGGTIAGIAQKPNSPTYDPAKVTIEAILSAVPEIQQWADVSGQQLVDQLKLEALIESGMSENNALKKPEVYVNLCSCALTEYHLRLLKDRVEQALNRDQFDAVIITHGTDTIEESAFFLEMTVRSDKPVILIGAGRPSNHPEADGPDNVRDAVKVAMHPQAQGRGVMVVFHGQIHPAFNVTEVEATRTDQALVDRFSSPKYGSLGKVLNGLVTWNESNLLNQNNFRNIKFPSSYRRELPKVQILSQYVGADNVSLMNLYRSQGMKGFVVAGYGMGSTSQELREMIAATLEPGSTEVFLTASRTKNAVVDPTVSYQTKDYMKGSVFAGSLSPYHAKIFLQLVLAGLDDHMPELMDITKNLPASSTLREQVREIVNELLYKKVGQPN